MTIRLLNSKNGRLEGATVQFGKNAEDALVIGNQATVAADNLLTTGAYTQNTPQGRAAIAAGASSVVITNSMVDANTKVWACVAQTAADGTLLRVERVVPAAGSFTIFGTANATATTFIDWAIISGEVAGGGS